MQFTKVDDDAYTVLMNLDTINRIANSFTIAVNEGSPVGTDERDTVLETSFRNAYERLSQPETSDEPVEAPESE